MYVPAHLLAPLVATLLLLATPAGAQGELSAFAVQPGYSLSVDSAGFTLPTAIAFVPAPRDAPDAPLYFVAELRGTIKVVTNDRSVREFARVPAERGQGPDLFGSSQSGLAGLCLDPARGHVFATYTETDGGGVLRNRLVRFTTEPGGFGLRPAETRSMDRMLTPFQSAPAHQIGNCVVQDDRLFIGVGDGGNLTKAADRSVLLGKVLCLDPDGNPCPDNPFFRDAVANGGSAPGNGGSAPGGDERGGTPPEAFVYAYGFRNPFGLISVQGELYAAENGVDADRFVRVRAGRDHLWRGTDQSLAALADLVFTPAIGPVQLAHVPPGSTVVDEAWQDRFVVAAFGGEKGTSAGLVGFGLPVAGRPPDLPRYLLEHTGPPGQQRFAAAALGPDGIYTAPMVPGPDGASPVLRLRHDPTRAHARTVQARSGLESLSGLGPLGAHGCVSCHQFEGGGGGGGIGPSLDRFGVLWRLTKRLNSAEYEAQVARVDALTEEPFARWGEARRAVLAAQGIERTWTWLLYFLQETRFDRPETQMPNLGLTEREAKEVRARLFETVQLSAGPLWQRGLRYAWRNAMPLLAGLAAGAGLGLAAGLALVLLLRRRPLRGDARQR